MLELWSKPDATDLDPCKVSSNDLNIFVVQYWSVKCYFIKLYVIVFGSVKYYRG